MVPICFQLSSLIYGYIRRKKINKNKLEANLHKSDANETEFLSSETGSEITALS